MSVGDGGALSNPGELEADPGPGVTARKRRPHPLVIVLAICGLMAVLGALALGGVIISLVKKAEPQSFSSVEGRFSADLPGEPNTTRSTSDAGVVRTTIEFWQPLKGTVARVEYHDRPALEPGDYNAQMPEGKLADDCAWTIRCLGTPAHDTSLTVQGYPARDLVIAEKPIAGMQPYYQRIRTVVADGRVFRLTYRPAGADGGSELGDRFFNSFRIAELPVPAWEGFRPEAEAFTALMPGKPVLRTNPSTDASRDLFRYGAHDRKTGTMYAVQYYGLAPPEAGYEVAADRTLGDEIARVAPLYCGKLVSRAGLTVCGHPARDIRWTTSEESANHVWYRLVLTPTRMYRLVVAPIGPDDAQAKKFMNSFQITQ